MQHLGSLVPNGHELHMAIGSTRSVRRQKNGVTISLLASERSSSESRKAFPAVSFEEAMVLRLKPWYFVSARRELSNGVSITP